MGISTYTTKIAKALYDDFYITHNKETMITDLRSISRPHFLVAVGVLVNDKGEFLLASRPEGKSYPGYWEFPGGKIETCEDAYMVLSRELQEEIDITVTKAQLWLEKSFDYPHANVTLFFFHITCNYHLTLIYCT